MPTHYALSEAAIVIVALWGTANLIRVGSRTGAFGVALIGLAAAIGTVRFAGGDIAALAVPHRLVSQVGGVIGLGLLLLGAIAAIIDKARWQIWSVALAGVALILAASALLRRAEWLDEATAWHTYHLTVALGLACYCCGKSRKLREGESPLAPTSPS